MNPNWSPYLSHWGSTERWISTDRWAPNITTGGLAEPTPPLREDHMNNNPIVIMIYWNIYIWNSKIQYVEYIIYSMITIGFQYSKIKYHDILEYWISNYMEYVYIYDIWNSNMIVYIILFHILYE